MIDDEQRIAKLTARAVEALRDLPTDRAPDRRSRRLIEAAQAIDDLGRLLRGRRSGRQMIFDTLRSAYPDPVPGSVLRTVSGIQEYARRIREIRETGYRIDSTPAGYRLVLSPDSLTQRRELISAIRSQPGDAISRVRALLSSNPGVVFSEVEVSHVAQTAAIEWILEYLGSDEVVVVPGGGGVFCRAG